MPSRKSQKPDSLDEFYTPGEVARMFGVTTRTVANWCDKGILQSVETLGGQRRILASSIKDGREYDSKLTSFAQRMAQLRAGAPIPRGEEIARAVEAARGEVTPVQAGGEPVTVRSRAKTAGEEAGQRLKRVVRKATTDRRHQ